MNPKILVAAPCGTNPRIASFYDCFYNLILPVNNPRPVRIPGGSLPINRNTIIDLAIKENFTHICLFDDDLLFAPDTVMRLLAHDKDVVAGLCVDRNPPFRAYVWDSIDARGKLGFAEIQGNGLRKVLAVGAAGILIKTAVFKLLDKPYFEHHFVGEEFWGDDINFCKSLINASIDVYCDTDITLWHANLCAIAPIFEDGKWVIKIMINNTPITIPAVWAQEAEFAGVK